MTIVSSVVICIDGVTRKFRANGTYSINSDKYTYYWRLKNGRVEYRIKGDDSDWDGHASFCHNTNLRHQLQELLQVQPNKKSEIVQAIAGLNNCDKAAVTKLVESIVGYSLKSEIEYGPVYKAYGSTYITFRNHASGVWGIYLSSNATDRSNLETWNALLNDGRLVRIADNIADYCHLKEKG